MDNAARCGVFTAVKIQVEVLQVVTSYGVVMRESEDGGSKVLRNFNILPQHHTSYNPEDDDLNYKHRLVNVTV
jgi:hypothetical protein